MKRLLLFLALATPAAFGQAFYQFPSPLPNGKFTVCGVPAVNNPCANRASIFADSGLTQPLTQPVQIDKDGYYGFWVTPGQYTIQISPPYSLQYIVSLGGGGGGGGGTVNNGGPGLAFYAVAGTAVSADPGSTTDGAGNVTVNTATATTKVAVSGTNGGFFATEGTGAALTFQTGQDFLYSYLPKHCWAETLNSATRLDECLMAANGTWTVGDLLQVNSAVLFDVSDTGIVAANVPTASANFVSGNVVQGAGANKTLSDSGVVAANLVTASSTYTASGDLVQAAGANRTTSDSGVVAANVATASANFTNGDVVQAAGANKTLSDSGIVAANVVTASANYTNGDVVQAAGANKTTSDSGVVAANLTTAASAFTNGDVVQAAGNNRTESDSGVIAANLVTASSAYTASGDMIQAAGANRSTSDAGFTAGNVVRKDAANTGAAAMTLDMSAATGASAFKVPVQAGATSTANGGIAYDSTANKIHASINGVDKVVCTTNGETGCASGGGVTGSGTTGRVPQWTSGSAIGDTSPVLDNGNTTANTLTYAGTGGFTLNGVGNQFTSTQGSITANGPFLTHTVTWNGGTIAFVDNDHNITCTASAALSIPWRYQVGGTTQTQLIFNGANCANLQWQMPLGAVATPSLIFSSSDTGVGFWHPATGKVVFAGGSTNRVSFDNANQRLSLSNSYAFQWSATGDATATPDIGFGRVAANKAAVCSDAGCTNTAGGLQLGKLFTTNLLISVTAPTISSGFGTSPSIANNNGTAAFTVNVGTGGSATSGVVGLPTATNGWACQATDITTTSATVFITKQTASSTTSATFGNFNTSAAAAAWVASDILSISCFAY